MYLGVLLTWTKVSKLSLCLFVKQDVITNISIYGVVAWRRGSLEEDWVSVKFYDLSSYSHGPVRRLWADYLSVLDGTIFVVDAADPDRFQEAKDYLHVYMLSHGFLKKSS